LYIPVASPLQKSLARNRRAARTSGALSGSSPLTLRVAVVADGLGQIVALALFFYNLWPRIRTAGARMRED